VTSSVSAPHVCESMAYRGISLTKSLVKLNSPSLLRSEDALFGADLRGFRERDPRISSCRVVMHAKLLVEFGVEVGSRPTQLNGSLAAVGSLRARKTNQSLASYHGWCHGWLSGLFDVHARLSHDLFWSLKAHLD
jgi:hypothetical protein